MPGTLHQHAHGGIASVQRQSALLFETGFGPALSINVGTLSIFILLLTDIHGLTTCSSEFFFLLLLCCHLAQRLARLLLLFLVQELSVFLRQLSHQLLLLLVVLCLAQAIHALQTPKCLLNLTVHIHALKDVTDDSDALGDQELKVLSLVILIAQAVECLVDQLVDPALLLGI